MALSRNLRFNGDVLRLTLMTNISLGIACLGLILNGAACGTAYSRGNGTMFGAYPFQAVVIDGYFISKTFNAPEEFMGMRAPGPLFLVWGLISLPIDVAIDVVTLPIDVGAWIAGCYKNPAQQPSRQPEQRNSGPGDDVSRPAAGADLRARQ